MHSIVSSVIQPTCSIDSNKKRKYENSMWSNKMMPKIYNPPPHGYCKVMPIYDATNIGLVIGKNGTIFNAITHQTPDVNYIWYNRNSKCIEVWGENSTGIEMACHKILERMNYVNTMPKKEE